MKARCHKCRKIKDRSTMLYSGKYYCDEECAVTDHGYKYRPEVPSPESEDVTAGIFTDPDHIDRDDDGRPKTLNDIAKMIEQQIKDRIRGRSMDFRPMLPNDMPAFLPTPQASPSFLDDVYAAIEDGDGKVRW